MRSSSRRIARYGRIDLLCIDELGYMKFDRRGAELLFQSPHRTRREEKSLRRDRLQRIFLRLDPGPSPDPRLCAAVVDRLTFIETGTDSYRLNHTRAQHS